MKNVKIAIYDLEEDYAFGLMDYMNSQKSNPIMAMAFTREDALLEYLQQNRVELLLAEESVNDNVIEGVRCLKLVKELGKQSGMSIFKYQSAEMVIRIVMKELGRNGVGRIRRRKSRIVGVYSPCGRCGKTTLAQAICCYRKESLYLGFEEYSSFDSGCDLMEKVLYYVRQRIPDIMDKIKELCIREDYCLIPSPRCYLDVKEMSFEEMEWFFEQIRLDDSFDVVVVDLGTGCLTDFALLDLFDVVFMPVSEGEREELKCKKFMDLLRVTCLSPMEDKIHRVCVPVCDVMDGELQLFVAGLMKGEVDDDEDQGGVTRGCDWSD